MTRGTTTIVLGLLMLAVAAIAFAQKPATLEIDYSGFAERISLAKGHLDGEFRQRTPMAQAASLDLSPQQVELYRKWVDQFQVFSLTNPDVPIADPNHPGAEEREFLLVRLGDKKLELLWTGVSEWKSPESKDKLERALDALVKMSLDMLKQAGKI